MRYSIREIGERRIFREIEDSPASRRAAREAIESRVDLVRNGEGRDPRAVDARVRAVPERYVRK